MSNTTTKKPVKAGTSHVLKEKLLYSGRWSEMVEFSYEDDEKQVRKWEGLHRKHRATAVIIIAKLKPSGDALKFKSSFALSLLSFDTATPTALPLLSTIGPPLLPGFMIASI